jgi:hypothetical protein
VLHGGRFVGLLGLAVADGVRVLASDTETAGAEAGLHPYMKRTRMSPKKLANLGNALKIFTLLRL